MERDKFTEEEKLRKENRFMRIALISLAGVLLVALAVVLFFVVYNGVKPAESTPTEPSAPAVQYSEYTASKEEAIAAADQIVGHIGDISLTNAELQAYYYMQVYDFVQNTGGYVSYYGLDLSKPLGEQVYNSTTGQTWEELFLEQAINSWNRYTVLRIMAEEAGYQLSAEEQAQLDAIPEQMKELATQLEYESVEKMVSGQMGASCTFEGYLRFMHTNIYCNSYFEQMYTDLAPTMEEMEAYYSENEETFVNAGASKEMGSAVDVRHILLIPEGGTPIEGTNYKEYTEDAWEACRVKAQGILDEYLAGDRSESSFSALAAKYSVDGSASQGGLISNITKGKTVQAFNDWIFDESREYGDYDLVRTEYGYHIMFFVSIEVLWARSAKTTMIGERAAALIDAAVEKTATEVNMDLIKLSPIEF